MVKRIENKVPLDDETLTTPEHDRLILDLLNKDSICILFPELEQYKEKIQIFSERPIKSLASNGKEGKIVGYWDIVVNIPLSSDDGWCIINSHDFGAYREYIGEVHPIYIEVKPTIHSFGTTLRQLNKYVEYSGVGKKNVYLYTPDNTFKEAFESQGFKVLNHL